MTPGMEWKDTSCYEWLKIRIMTGMIPSRMESIILRLTLSLPEVTDIILFLTSQLDNRQKRKGE